MKSSSSVENSIFTWRKVDCQFKIKFKEKTIRIPLKSNIQLASSNIQLASQSNSIHHIQSKLHVDIEKPLQFEDSIGWNWHKSSNLPIFSLKLERQKPISSFNTSFQSQSNIFLIKFIFNSQNNYFQATIYAVKIVHNLMQNENNIYLQQIGIKGQNSVLLYQGCGYFSGLKFASTSYNNQGINFHLLIVVHENIQQKQIPENILTAIISPPIFVDSRKSARNHQQKRYLSSVELFEPSQILKKFSKKDSKQDSELIKQILNNAQGLYNYLTASNIRHKVKHPLFLAIKFSNAFQICINTTKKCFSKKQINLIDVINRFQKKLINQIGTVKSHRNKDGIVGKEFIVFLSNQTKTYEKQKILEILNYLDTDSIKICQQDLPIPQEFKNIAELGNLEQAYEINYKQLKKKSEKQIQARNFKKEKHQEKYKYFEGINHNESKQNDEQLVIQQKKDSFNNKYSKEQNLNQIQQFNDDNMNESFQKYEKMRKCVKQCNQNLLSLNNSFTFPKSSFYQSEQFPQFSLQQHQQFSRQLSKLTHNCQMPDLNQDDYLKFKISFQKQRKKGLKGSIQDLTKKQQQQFHIWVSKKQIQQKIQKMCQQVYKRNKYQLLGQLQTLKKSNVGWKVKDIQQCLFTYSSALMNELHFRQSLLRHMYLENEIIKAKVMSMQSNSEKELQDLKSNILSMNKFLPASFIQSKLKSNSLFQQNSIIMDTQKVMNGKQAIMKKGETFTKKDQAMPNNQGKKNSLQINKPEILNNCQYDLVRRNNNLKDKTNNKLKSRMIVSKVKQDQFVKPATDQKLNKQIAKQNQKPEQQKMIPEQIDACSVSGQLSSSCHFVPNVFDISSSSVNL